MIENVVVPFTPLRKMRRRLGKLWERTTLITQGVVSIPCKLWYANTVGFANNFGPLRELKRLRRHFAVHPASFDANVVLQSSQLRDNGYLVLRGQHDPSFLSDIRTKLSQYIENPEKSILSRTKASRFLLNPLENIPELAQFLSDELCHIIAAYYGCALSMHHVQVWRNYHVPNLDQNRTEVFSNFFHHDHFPVTGLRVFVLLNDGVRQGTGAFRFHDKKTSKKMVRRLGYFQRYVVSAAMQKRLLNSETLKFFEGEMGDIGIVNTQECLHAASIPQLGSYRDMLEFQIYPTDGSVCTGAALFKQAPADCQTLDFYK